MDNTTLEALTSLHPTEETGTVGTTVNNLPTTTTVSQYETSALVQNTTPEQTTSFTDNTTLSSSTEDDLVTTLTSHKQIFTTEPSNTTTTLSPPFHKSSTPLAGLPGYKTEDDDEFVAIDSVGDAVPLIVVCAATLFVIVVVIIILGLCCYRKAKASKDSYSTLERRRGTEDNHDIPTTIHEASTLPVRSRRPRAQPFEIINAYDNSAYSTYPRRPQPLDSAWFKRHQQPPVIKYRDTALLPPRKPLHEQDSSPRHSGPGPSSSEPNLLRQEPGRRKQGRLPIPMLLVPPQDPEQRYIRTLPTRSKASRSNSFPDRVPEDLQMPTKDDLHKGRMSLSTGLTNSRSDLTQQGSASGVLRGTASGSLYLDPQGNLRNNQSLC